MNCDTARKLFVNYEDGDLPSRKRQALENHLKVCDECQEEWKDYQKTLEGISGMHDLLPSPDFVSKVKQTIGKRSRGRFFGESQHQSVAFAVVSFVLILLFLLAYLFISHSIEIEVIPKIDPPPSSPENGE